MYIYHRVLTATSSGTQNEVRGTSRQTSSLVLPSLCSARDDVPRSNSYNLDTQRESYGTISYPPEGYNSRSNERNKTHHSAPNVQNPSILNTVNSSCASSANLAFHADSHRSISSMAMSSEKDTASVRKYMTRACHYCDSCMNVHRCEENCPLTLHTASCGSQKKVNLVNLDKEFPSSSKKTSKSNAPYVTSISIQPSLRSSDKFGQNLSYDPQKMQVPQHTVHEFRCSPHLQFEFIPPAANGQDSFKNDFGSRNLRVSNSTEKSAYPVSTIVRDYSKPFTPAETNEPVLIQGIHSVRDSPFGEVVEACPSPYTDKLFSDDLVLNAKLSHMQTRLENIKPHVGENDSSVSEKKMPEKKNASEVNLGNDEYHLRTERSISASRHLSHLLSLKSRPTSDAEGSQDDLRRLGNECLHSQTSNESQECSFGNKKAQNLPIDATSLTSRDNVQALQCLDLASFDEKILSKEPSCELSSEPLSNKMAGMQLYGKYGQNFSIASSRQDMSLDISDDAAKKLENSSIHCYDKNSAYDTGYSSQCSTPPGLAQHNLVLPNSDEESLKVSSKRSPSPILTYRNALLGHDNLLNRLENAAAARNNASIHNLDKTNDTYHSSQCKPALEDNHKDTYDGSSVKSAKISVPYSDDSKQAFHLQSE